MGNENPSRDVCVIFREEQKNNGDGINVYKCHPPSPYGSLDSPNQRPQRIVCLQRLFISPVGRNKSHTSMPLSLPSQEWEQSTQNPLNHQRQKIPKL